MSTYPEPTYSRIPRFCAGVYLDESLFSTIGCNDHPAVRAYPRNSLRIIFVFIAFQEFCTNSFAASWFKCECLLIFLSNQAPLYFSKVSSTIEAIVSKVFIEVIDSFRNFSKALFLFLH